MVVYALDLIQKVAIKDYVQILKIVFGVLGDLAIPLVVLESKQDMLKFQLNLVVIHVLEKEPNHVTRNRVRKSPKAKILQGFFQWP